MQNTATLNKKGWNSDKLVSPLLTVIFVETILMFYTIYSIPAATY